jgi:ElaB/YqjD/DUF883 family membrane-anchored ribosome-binding protein
MQSSTNEMKVLKKDLSKIKDIINHHAQDLIEDANGSSVSTIEELRTLAAETGEDLQKYLVSKRKQFNAAKKVCQSTIKEHPIKSAVAAAATGVLIASVLSFLRRR